MSTDPYTKVTELVSRRKFPRAKRIDRLCQRKFSREARRNLCLRTISNLCLVQDRSRRINNGSPPTEFIFFHAGTSIIDRNEIIAGAHKWLLSTMSSSSPAAACPWESFREAFQI